MTSGTADITCFLTVNAFTLECAKTFIVNKLQHGAGIVYDWGLEFKLPHYSGSYYFTFSFDVSYDFSPILSMSDSINKAETCACSECSVARILMDLDYVAVA